MLIFLDTANLDEIHHANRLGFCAALLPTPH